MTRRLLKPETYQTIPMRDQAPVPHTFYGQLTATCMAFRSADLSADYHAKRQEYPAAIKAAETAERVREALNLLLDQLIVR
jgi:hypothetical protein